MIALLTIAAAALPIDYRQPENWLCRPGRSDACSSETAASIVTPAGKLRTSAAAPRTTPKADCFYVYPTASFDTTPNSDMIPGIEERGMAAAQLAPFAGQCRMFAPIYRQVTLTALRQIMSGKPPAFDRELPYTDVLAAWRDYLAHDSGSRPFVLIGHSQGSMVLKRLIAEEIDGKPVQRRLLSAILPGATIEVPVGKDVGGDFKALPLCRSDAQTRCILTWASYRDTAPPPANALFGKAVTPGTEAGCTNPAALRGGTARLDARFGFPWFIGGVAQYRQPTAGWSVGGSPIPTRYLTVPGLLSGGCKSAGGVSYLTVHVEPRQPSELVDTLTSPATIGDGAYPEWGWHVVDMAIVAGDLVRLVGRQTEAWRPDRARN